NACALGRAATVVRHRRGIADTSHFDAYAAKSADCGFTACAGARDANINHAHAGVVLCLGSGGETCPLSGEGSALTRAAESERTRGAPADNVAHRVGDRDDGVVERSLNVHEADRHVLALFLLESFFLR